MNFSGISPFSIQNGKKRKNGLPYMPIFRGASLYFLSGQLSGTFLLCFVKKQKFFLSTISEERKKPDSSESGSCFLIPLEKLFCNFGYYSGSYCSSSFSNCKSQSCFHCNRVNQFYRHGDIISRHYHFHSFR